MFHNEMLEFSNFSSVIVHIDYYIYVSGNTVLAESFNSYNNIQSGDSSSKSNTR